MSRVTSAGVIVEGNSFLDYIKADFTITCARAGENKMKTSARRTLEKANALYLSTIDGSDRETAIERFESWRKRLSIELNTEGMAIYTRHDLANLIGSIRESLSVSSVPVAVNY